MGKTVQFEKRKRRQGSPFQAFAPRKWAVFAKSLRDAADFVPDVVRKLARIADTRCAFLLVSDKSLSHHARNLNVDTA